MGIIFGLIILVIQIVAVFGILIYIRRGNRIRWKSLFGAWLVALLINTGLKTLNLISLFTGFISFKVKSDYRFFFSVLSEIGSIAFFLVFLLGFVLLGKFILSKMRSKTKIENVDEKYII